MIEYTGLGFRKDFAKEILHREEKVASFLELAPENWMSLGGYWKHILDQIAEKYTLLAHGLSLSIATVDELDYDFLKQIKAFLDRYNIQKYSEHISFSQCGNIHLYELLPVPFTEEALHHLAERIQKVQDYLQRPLCLENISYYTTVDAEMKEQEFITEMVARSGCKLLLDINNVYVNSFNHKYDPYQFLKEIPLDAVEYIHIAGHTQHSKELIIDTHAEPIIDPVFDLFDYLCQQINPSPVLLERDFNIPELSEIEQELNEVERIAQKNWILVKDEK